MKLPLGWTPRDVPLVGAVHVSVVGICTCIGEMSGHHWAGAALGGFVMMLMWAAALLK